MHYSDREKAILDFTIAKVRGLFEQYPAPGHGFKHAEMTARYAREIAIGEKAASVFLAELAAYLHDIGRAAEHYDLGYTISGVKQSHHELSYHMLKDWFNREAIYNDLMTEEKIALLYAVRNHWNNQALKYEVAWILRDADKLDGFGAHGLERALEAHGHDPVALNDNLRFIYDCYYWIKSKTARDIIEREDLMGPFNAYYIDYLKERIKNVDE